MFRLSNFIPPVIQKCIPILVVAFGGIHVFKRIRQYSADLITSIEKRRMLEKWTKESPKDVVILHVFPAGRKIANPSPFTIKLETFLRMANIPYKIDTEFPKGEKEKTPWITLNGEHFTDSEFIIELLEKKFGKTFKNYNPNECAIGTMARLMMDEHFYWGLIHWRYVYSGGKHIGDIFPFYSHKDLERMKRVWKSKYVTYTWYQGVGRHSDKEIINLMCNDLKTLSCVIGTNKFLLGDEPSRDDCSVFGMLSQVVWAEVDSPYQTLIAESLHNLEEYCVNMKDRFWPDWNQVIVK